VDLAPREALCLAWAALGKTAIEIADLLGISEHTVRSYLRVAREKLGADNITHAVKLAAEQGLI
jgi:LuxR family transcriptional activator of conjugal transfer of Ti plasmids